MLEAVWAAAPQGGRERILLRACIQIANANLRLRMQKPHAAARLFGEALGELDCARLRKAQPAATALPMVFRPRRWSALLQGQTGAAAALQGRLGAISARQPNMKQNAYSGVLG